MQNLESWAILDTSCGSGTEKGVEPAMRVVTRVSGDRGQNRSELARIAIYDRRYQAGLKTDSAVAGRKPKSRDLQISIRQRKTGRNVHDAPGLNFSR
jgi:hypothetical protein